MFIDESHVTIPQVGGMYKGDRARKENLVNYGFRLPSALDNRPLRFDEFERLLPQTIFVSATPADYEQHARGAGGRAAGAADRPGRSDARGAARRRRRSTTCCRRSGCASSSNERVLVTTLTKRMAEDLTDYLAEHGVKVRYLHSDIDTVERVEIIRDLRLGEFDVLVGINLLREGLDIPEVSLVAILDADKEGFLRSERSLIQTIGRAARHINGMAILYADRMTDSMKAAIGETERRRDEADRVEREDGHHADRRAEAHQGHHRRRVRRRRGARSELQGRAGARRKYEAMPEKDMEKRAEARWRSRCSTRRRTSSSRRRPSCATGSTSSRKRCSAWRCRSRPDDAAADSRRRSNRERRAAMTDHNPSATEAHVLFVCLGNICRSPTAEGVFADMRCACRSCGTGSCRFGRNGRLARGPAAG